MSMSLFDASNVNVVEFAAPSVFDLLLLPCVLTKSKVKVAPREVLFSFRPIFVLSLGGARKTS